jgi:hypothetical protein
MQVGDIKKYKNHIVEILEIFVYNNIEYAEIKPLGYGFPIEIETKLLKEIVI